MEYDMETKRAQRLISKNWYNVVTEAHRLGALGGVLEVTIPGETRLVTLAVYPQTLPRGMKTYISDSGEVFCDTLIQWQDGHWEPEERNYRQGAEAVAEVLKMALEETRNRAKQVGEAATLLKAAGR